MPQKSGPVGAALGQTQASQKKVKPEYHAKDEQIMRPLLADLKRRIDTNMSADEVEKLLTDNQEWLRTTMSCEPEIEDVQKLLNAYLNDIEDISKTNLEAKQ